MQRLVLSYDSGTTAKRITAAAELLKQQCDGLADTRF